MGWDVGKEVNEMKLKFTKRERAIHVALNATHKIRAGKRGGRKGALGSYWQDWAKEFSRGKTAALRRAVQKSWVAA